MTGANRGDRGGAFVVPRVFSHTIWSRLGPGRERARPCASDGDRPVPDRNRQRSLGAVVRCAFVLVAALVASERARAFQRPSMAELRSSLYAWERAPEGWNGLSEQGALKFIESLQRARAWADDGGAQAPSRGEIRTLALRAAALEAPGTISPSLLGIAEEGRSMVRLLLNASDKRAQTWLAFEVFGQNSADVDEPMRGHDGWRPTTQHRRTALEILLEARIETTRGALLAVARRDDDPLRALAMRELGRWAGRFGSDEAIDLFLVRLLGTNASRGLTPHPLNVVLDRIESTDAPLGQRAQAALYERIGLMIISADWRKVAQALRLSQGLAPETRIPLLLDALSKNARRVKSNRPYPGMERIQGDLVRVLREISGQFHGPQPDPWIDWWVRVQQGKAPMPGTEAFIKAQERRDAEPKTTASFFGIRPQSDRVTFVLDFSGSMERRWHTSEQSRYVEAIDQLTRFLQAAPRATRFNIILFSDRTIRSSVELIEATPENIERVRTAMLARTPEGGTNLRPAIEEALLLGADGLPDLDRLEADTIIVLCDGETAEGRGWVKPLLRRVLPHHPVVFHTVHLGTQDDGALRDLATASGGRFVRS